MNLLKKVFPLLILIAAVHSASASPHMLVPMEKPSVRLHEGWIFKTGGEPDCGLFGKKNDEAEAASWKPYHHQIRISECPMTKSLWFRNGFSYTPEKDPVFYIQGNTFFNNFDLYLNGNKVYSSRYSVAGKLNPPSAMHLIQLGELKDENIVDIHLFSRMPFRHHGIIDIKLYSEKKLLHTLVYEQLDRIVLGFIFIFAGIASAIVFLRYRRSQVYYIASFALMSFSFGFFTIFSSEFSSVYLLSPGISFSLVYISLLLFPVGIFSFIENTIGPGYKNIIRRSWQLYLVLAVIFMLVYLSGVTELIFFGHQVRFLFIIISMGAAIAEQARAIYSGNRKARITSIGILIFLLTIVNDFFIISRHYDTIFFHSHWGFFALMICLGYILISQFEHSQEKLKEYSAELEDKSELLQNLNRTLEEKVQERTDELRMANDELKTINDQLIERNLVMENDISLARSIQRQLIPSSDPSENIYSLYKPMDMLGGDLYDYIKLDDGRLGIFISDVSGHGIPAAFITSMVKTIILQSVSLHSDPAALISRLNEILFGKTDNNFITAFYGIIDFNSGKIIFCNAGHNHPIIISGDTIEELCGSPGAPIGFMDNDYLSRKKPYINSEAVLPAESKLLFFTDGLTEAARIDNPSAQFEENGLQKSIISRSKAASRDLITGIYDDLKKFRGSNTFDDDVCLISVDMAGHPR